jgi:hypothetical protein
MGETVEQVEKRLKFRYDTLRFRQDQGCDLIGAFGAEMVVSLSL